MTAEQVGIIIGLVTGVGGLIVALWNAGTSARKATVEELRGLYEIERTNRIELQDQVGSLRDDLKERDEIIDDLKDWSERLTKQVQVHAPHVIPEKFIRRSIHAGQSGKDQI